MWALPFRVGLLRVFCFNAFCYAKRPVMAQAGYALTRDPNLIKVNHSIDHTRLISPIGKDLAPRVDDQ